MAKASRGTRSALLDAALDAFAARGFAGASIREITRVVGVRESAFYAHFTSKRTVYDELFAEAGPPVAARALDELADDSPRVFLPRLASSIIESWSTPRARKFAAMVMRDAFDNEGRGWLALRTSIDGVIALLVKRFEAWQNAGMVRHDVSPNTLAFEFMAPVSMARFIYFNVAAGRTEAARGHAVVNDHALSFARLCMPPHTNDPKNDS